MSRLIDEIGSRYGRLVVICEGERNNEGRHRWKCRCDCGNYVHVRGSPLRNGNTKSCGCLHKELMTDKIGGWNRLPKGEGAFNSLFYARRLNAIKRGYRWDITKEQFKTITSKECHYCGDNPSQLHRPYRRVNGKYVYNGLDRVDNTKGYTSDNVVPCCKQCNYAKGNMPIKEFFEWIFKVYNNGASDGRLG